MFFFEEELLEPLARTARFAKGFSAVAKNKPLRMVALGCGPKIRSYYAAKKYGIKIKSYIGIDPLLEASQIQKRKSVTIVKDPLKKSILLPSNCADIVVGFAFLEHIDHPGEILNDAVRILAPGGKAIFTTPTPRAKIILEFLAYKLGIIARREIEEHKNYFLKEDLLSLIKKSKLNKITHQYFELGCNNLFIIEKTSKRK